MTVYRGYTHDEDDLEHWANSLTIENGEDVLPDKVTAIPVVRVDTNYKPERTGAHPVHLTIADAIRAAAGLVSHAQNSVENFDTEGCTDVIDDAQLLDMLVELTNVDGAVWELRTYLHAEIHARRQQAAERPTNDVADAIIPTPSSVRTGEAFDAAFLPHAIVAVKRLARKQMPLNANPIPWWPLEVDGAQAVYIRNQMSHPLRVIAAHSDALDALHADQSSTRGSIVDVVGQVRERMERMAAAVVHGGDLRALADVVQSGIVVLAGALPDELPTDTQKDDR